MADASVEWPVDIDKLSKGDSIPPEVLGPFFGDSYGSHVYQRKLMAFVADLEVALVSKGKKFVLRCRQGSAAILTDLEASVYTQARFDSHVFGLMRANRRTKRVDATNLPPDERERLSRAVVVQGAVLSVMTRTLADLKAVPYQRNIPLAFDDKASA